MRERSLLMCTLVVMGVAMIFGGVNATQETADTLTMNSTVYEKHTKPLVTFTHKKHNVDYKIPCADCHHVYKDGANAWKEGDAVEKCQACHSQAKPPKAGAGQTNLSKEEKIKAYHYAAIHENCVGCHKELKKAGKQTGPVSCKECHV